MLLYQGQFYAMIYRNADLKQWLPVLKDQPVGFAGMFYLAVDDLEGTYEHVRRHAEVVKPLTDDPCAGSFRRRPLHRGCTREARAMRKAG